MSYWLEDANGFLGDLATNRGISQLRDAPNTPDSVRAFLEAGEADASLLQQVIEDLMSSAFNDPLMNLLRKAKTPVIVTDGVGSVELENE